MEGGGAFEECTVIMHSERFYGCKYFGDFCRVISNLAKFVPHITNMAMVKVWFKQLAFCRNKIVKWVLWIAFCRNKIVNMDSVDSFLQK